MSLPDSSVLLVLLSGGLGAGGLAGYLTRRLQKVEERIDNTTLKVLPAVYYNTYYFIDSAIIFHNNGSLEKFAEKVKEINQSLKSLISSGDIIPSDNELKGLFKKILDFHSELELIEDFLRRNSPIENAPGNVEINKEQAKRNNIQDLRKSFSQGGASLSLSTDLRKATQDATELNTNIENKLKGYKSISLRLLLLIVGVGVAVAAVELITSSVGQ
jgi:hypothetical protein